MRARRDRWWLALILTGSACGPGRLLSDDGHGTSTSSSSSESGASESGGASESDADSSDTVLPKEDQPDELGSCDPFAQNCPEGHKCVPTEISLEHECVPVLGDQAPGEPCVYAGPPEFTDDCDANSSCWAVTELDGELIGTCYGFCTGTLDMAQCPDGLGCTNLYVLGPYFCAPECNAAIQDCPEGEGCYWVEDSFSCSPSANSVPIGQPCGMQATDCAPGGVCLDSSSVPDCNGASCCAPYCDLELGGSECDVLPGTACEPFFEQGTAPPHHDHIGICVLQP